MMKTNTIIKLLFVNFIARRAKLQTSLIVFSVHCSHTKHLWHLSLFQFFKKMKCICCSFGGWCCSPLFNATVFKHHRYLSTFALVSSVPLLNDFSINFLWFDRAEILDLQVSNGCVQQKKEKKEKLKKLLFFSKLIFSSEKWIAGSRIFKLTRSLEIEQKLVNCGLESGTACCAFQWIRYDRILCYIVFFFFFFFLSLSFGFFRLYVLLFLYIVHILCCLS